MSTASVPAAAPVGTRASAIDLPSVGENELLRTRRRLDQ
jgi:hypothetical protein